jgi:hypothetical protein
LVGYALASLGCALPIFLAVLASSVTPKGVSSAGGAFFTYAAEKDTHP